MSKRGQVSVFIILGIIVVALFGALLALKGDIVKDFFKGSSSERFTSPDIEPVKQVVASCVEESLLKGVEYVSNRGGYFNPINSSFYSRDVDGVIVAYAWTDKYGSRLPDLKGLGNQIRYYMEDHMGDIKDCIDDNLGDYKKSWNIENEKDFSLDVPRISDNKILQKINYNNEPLTVSKDEYVATASEILGEVDIALGQAWKMANEIVSCYGGVNNEYCNRDGVRFRAEIYSLFKPQNVVGLMQQACGDECDQCYYLKIPADEGDIIFNVEVREC